MIPMEIIVYVWKGQLKDGPFRHSVPWNVIIRALGKQGHHYFHSEDIEYYIGADQWRARTKLRGAVERAQAIADRANLIGIPGSENEYIYEEVVEEEKPCPT